MKPNDQPASVTLDQMRTWQAATRSWETDTRTGQAEARAEQAEARTKQAEARTQKAEARTEQAETRTEQAETRTEQAETRTAQAETRTEQAKTRAELAETRAEQAEMTLLQRGVNKELDPRPEISARLLQITRVEEIADPSRPLELLTNRQRKILQLIAEGQNTKQIADVLAVSPKTIEYHRMKLMHCLNVHDVPGLVRFALRVGLINQES